MPFDRVKTNLHFNTLGLIVLILCLTACAPLVGYGSVPPTLKIGLVAPFEGIDRRLGYEALFAVKLARSREKSK